MSSLFSYLTYLWYLADTNAVIDIMLNRKYSSLAGEQSEKKNFIVDFSILIVHCFATITVHGLIIIISEPNNLCINICPCHVFNFCN